MNPTGNVVPIKSRGGPVTRAAWMAYVTRRTTRPKPASLARYERASSEVQDNYNRDRMAYHRSLGHFQTRQMTDAHRVIDSRVEGSDGCEAVARNGLILDGRPLIGKSTILLRWGVGYETRLRHHYGVDFDARTEDGALFIPVVYVILGDGDGPKGFCQKLMRFYNQEYREYWDEGELTARLHELSVSCATSVLCIDQMQNLKMKNKSAQQTAAHLKELMDTLPVTMIGAGVNMMSTGFFTEGKAVRQDDDEKTQTEGRFTRHAMDIPDIQTPEGQADWDSFLASVSERIILLRSRDNDIPRLSEYIYQRTGGVTGHVMDLLRLGANAAVGTNERITKTLLEGVRLSQAVDGQAPADDEARRLARLIANDEADAMAGRALKQARSARR